jgi:hypothetical protein
MSNMSYCRFQNTASDLEDCVENLFELDQFDLSQNNVSEWHARDRILELAFRMMEEIGMNISESEFNLRRDQAFGEIRS